MTIVCHHVYENTGYDDCPTCGKPTHEVNWKFQNALMKKWLKDNPDAWKTVGWWSI